jgi:hypothetical protein
VSQKTRLLCFKYAKAERLACPPYPPEHAAFVRNSAMFLALD